MSMGGCLCYTAPSSKVEPFPVVPYGNGCNAAATPATSTGGNNAVVRRAAGAGTGVKPKQQMPPSCPSLKTALKSPDDAGTGNRVAFSISATATDGCNPDVWPHDTETATAAATADAAAAAADNRSTRVLVTTSVGPSCGSTASQQRNPTARGGSGASAGSVHAPLPVVGSPPATIGTNGSGASAARSNWASSGGTLSGISAGSKYCFSEAGTCTDVEYDEHEYETALATGLSEPGECCDFTSEPGGPTTDPYDDDGDGEDPEPSGLSGGTAASSSYAAATAAAQLRAAAAAATANGGSSGGGPSRSVKSNGSTWSFKVMADLQLMPDRSGRLRLPSILMFTSRRPPRHARTQAWWTKIRGILVYTGRNGLLPGIGRRSQRARARTGTTEDGTSTTVGSTACGGLEDDGAGPSSIQPSVDDPPNKVPLDLRAISRGTTEDGGGGSSALGRGDGAASGASKRCPRSQSGASRLKGSEGIDSGVPGHVAALPSPAANPAAAAAAAAAAAQSRPSAGPGLPGAVQEAPRPISVQRQAAGSINGRISCAGNGGGSKPAALRVAVLATCVQRESAAGPGATNSFGGGGAGSGRGGGVGEVGGCGSSNNLASARSSTDGRSRSKRCSYGEDNSYHGVSSAGGTGGGGGGSDNTVAVSVSAASAAAVAAVLGLSVQGYGRQLPPLGMAFAAGPGDFCDAAPEPPEMRTPTEDVALATGFGESIPGEAPSEAVAGTDATATAGCATAAGAAARPDLRVSCSGRALPVGVSNAASGKFRGVGDAGCSSGRVRTAAVSSPGALPPPAAVTGRAGGVPSSDAGLSHRHLPGHVARGSLPEGF